MLLLYLKVVLCLSLTSILPEADARYRRVHRKQWKFKATADGYIYASRYFRYRYKATMDPNVCFNIVDKPPELNDTFSNGSRMYSSARKTYQNFLCPLIDLRRSYCCGPPSQQVCCSYWSDYGRAVGASFGLSIASVVLLWVIYGVMRVMGTKCPKMKRNCGPLFCVRQNNVQQGPSPSEPSPPPSPPPPSSETASGSAEAEPKPLSVAPLAPPTYSSLSVRQVDYFGDSLASDLPPPPSYCASE